MPHLTIFRQDLHAFDTIIDYETELLQSYVPANTPMSLRAVVILERGQRNGSDAAALAAVKATPARGKSVGGVAPRKTLAGALSGMGEVAARLQQRRKVDKRQDVLRRVLAIRRTVTSPKVSAINTARVTRSHQGKARSGYYGDSLAVGQDSSTASNLGRVYEEKIIEQATKIYYFYHMDITEEHVGQIVRDHGIVADDERMKLILRWCEKLREKYEENTWGDFKSCRMCSHSSPLYETLHSHKDSLEDADFENTPYERMNEREKWQFWFSQWNISDGLVLLEPLKKAIRCEEALRDPKWGNYIRKIWAAANMSAWQNHVQYSKETAKHLFDREQIREDIREAADKFCADRPPIGDVPIHFGGILDTGPRKSKDQEIDVEDPDWFEDARFGPPETVI